MTESAAIDTIDFAVLDVLQDEFPLTGRPWTVIATRVGITEEDLLNRLGRLRKEGIIRGISPVIDSRCMGLTAATLVALHIPDERKEEAARIINSYPEVSHNFCREHYYSLWFTISAENETKMGKVLGEILRKTGVDDENVIDLPTVRKFKVDVRFPLSPRDGGNVHGPR